MEYPYCFSTNDNIVYVEKKYSNIYYVYCADCGMRGSTQCSKEEAIKAFDELMNINTYKKQIEYLYNEVERLEQEAKGIYK